MSVTALSFTFNLYAPTAPTAPAKPALEPSPQVTKTDAAPGDTAAGPRPQRLAQALGTALRELGVGSTDTATGGAAVDTAVHAFAHALWDALAPPTRDAGGRSGEHRQDGAHGHHGHHHGARAAYGDLAQRLEALSQTVAATPDAGSQPISVTPPTPATAPAAADGVAATETPVRAAEVPADTTPTAPAPAATTSAARSPLIDAFAKLYAALQPQAASASAGDIAGKLQQFLHTLAQSLGGGTTSPVADAPVPTSGAFVDVSA